MFQVAKAFIKAFLQGFLHPAHKSVNSTPPKDSPHVLYQRLDALQKKSLTPKGLRHDATYSAIHKDTLDVLDSLMDKGETCEAVVTRGLGVIQACNEFRLHAPLAKDKKMPVYAAEQAIAEFVEQVGARAIDEDHDRGGAATLRSQVKAPLQEYLGRTRSMGGQPQSVRDTLSATLKALTMSMEPTGSVSNHASATVKNAGPDLASLRAGSSLSPDLWALIDPDYCPPVEMVTLSLPAPQQEIVVEPVQQLLPPAPKTEIKMPSRPSSKPRGADARENPTTH